MDSLRCSTGSIQRALRAVVAGVCLLGGIGASVLGVNSRAIFAQGCLDGAGGLASFGTEEYWVSSFGTSQLLRFDQAGSLLGSFGHPTLIGPRGITFRATNELYVASQLNSQILVFDAQGTFQRSFGHALLSGPTGATNGPDGDYYVCSFNNSRILRFDATESLVDSYVSPGLSGPNCIVFLPSGEFLVTGQLSNDVHRFSPAGAPLGSFPTGQSSVMGAALDLQGRLLVAGGASDDVRLFDCSGTVLTTWSVAGGPQSIATREDGTIYVTTFYTHRVVRLDAMGNSLGFWTGGNTLRGLEFIPAPPPVFTRGDANRDGSIDVADAVRILGALFGSAEALECQDAGDANDDGNFDVADAVRLLGHLFQGGSDLASPFRLDGGDPTPDGLGCLN